MKKERLTVASVKSDLIQMLNTIDCNVSDARMSLIVPSAMLAVILGAVLQNIVVGLVIAVFPIYHTVRYIKEVMAISSAKKDIVDGIERGEISVARETLSHIAEETIYEPHSTGRRKVNYKTIQTFYFQGGASWRLRPISYYSWSKDYHMSPAGVYNTSVAGDEFYVVRLQKQYEVACVYNTKMFEWENTDNE